MEQKQKTIVVTRHQGLIDYLLEEGIIDGTEPVITHTAKPREVAGCHVIGVLPLHLAVMALSVTEVPLDYERRPEWRGKELSKDMVRVLAMPVVTYRVTQVGTPKGIKPARVEGMLPAFSAPYGRDYLPLRVKRTKE